jgi:hypothetical protein
MKNILFVVGNEYHLYSAICMYYKYFSSEDYNFKLIITKRPKNLRIRTEYDLPFEYHVFDDYLGFHDCRSIKIFPDYENMLKSIFESVDEMYTYFDFTLLITKIIKRVKRNPKAKVYMVQEGVAGYLYRKKANLIILKFYLTYLYIKYIKGLKNMDFVYQWGRYKRIDELKMFHPEMVKPHIHAPATKLDLNVSSETNKKIKKIFNVNIEVDSSKRYLLYLTIAGARGSMDAKNLEYSLIEKLINIAKEHQLLFIIKTKSGSDSQIYKEKFGHRVQIIDAKIPAEILISDIHNSLIVSAFSSAALHDVNNNINLWIYPILKHKVNLQPITPNIKLLYSIDELIRCINEFNPTLVN